MFNKNMEIIAQKKSLTMGAGLIGLSRHSVYTECTVYVPVIPIDPFENATRWAF